MQCGHGAFSSIQWVCDVVGFVSHSLLQYGIVRAGLTSSGRRRSSILCSGRRTSAGGYPIIVTTATMRPWNGTRCMSRRPGVTSGYPKNTDTRLTTTNTSGTLRSTLCTCLFANNCWHSPRISVSSFLFFSFLCAKALILCEVWNVSGQKNYPKWTNHFDRKRAVSTGPGAVSADSPMYLSELDPVHQRTAPSCHYVQPRHPLHDRVRATRLRHLGRSVRGQVLRHSMVVRYPLVSTPFAPPRRTPSAHFLRSAWCRMRVHLLRRLSCTHCIAPPDLLFCLMPHVARRSRPLTRTGSS